MTYFLYGGLNYQIEHHLFPAMPRKALRRVSRPSDPITASPA